MGKVRKKPKARRKAKKRPDRPHKFGQFRIPRGVRVVGFDEAFKDVD